MLYDIRLWSQTLKYLSSLRASLHQCTPQIRDAYIALLLESMLLLL